MPSSNAIKRKASTELPRLPSQAKAIIFRLGKAKPDTRIKVFDQWFHVHSAILLVEAEWFKRFLISGDKANAPIAGAWKYDYVTTVDQDGTWGLEASYKVSDESINRRLLRPEDIEEDTKSFHNLLKILYKKPNPIIPSDDIRNLLKMADFFLAIPALNAALSTGLPSLCENIFEDPLPFLVTAIKAQNHILYREATILICALWNVKGKSKNWEEYIGKYYPGVLDRIQGTAQAFIDNELYIGALLEKYMKDEPTLLSICKLARKKTLSQWSKVETRKSPSYYRHVYEGVREITDEEGWEDKIKHELKILLKSDLVVDRNRVSGSGACELLFLSYGIEDWEDNDQPWHPDYD